MKKYAGLFGLLLLAGLAAAQPMFGGPEDGEEAPAFALKDLSGREVTLAEFRKKKPVVLVTGSYSCPVYRQQSRALERLFERYGSRAAFFLLYTVEAHPAGDPSPYTGAEWVTEPNRREGVLVRQPATEEERAALAAKCRQALMSRVPVLLDRMDNATWEQYGRLPNGAYLIDVKGKIRLRQEWFQPAPLEEALLELIQENPPKW